MRIGICSNFLSQNIDTNSKAYIVRHPKVMFF